MRFLFDTNIVLLHMATGFLNQAWAEHDFFVSVITEAELLRYPGIGAYETNLIDSFLSITTVIEINSTIARRAALIGRTRKIKLPDLLIAATALELDAILISKNFKDFRTIPGLHTQTDL